MKSRNSGVKMTPSLFPVTSSHIWNPLHDVTSLGPPPYKVTNFSYITNKPFYAAAQFEIDYKSGYQQNGLLL